MQADHIDSVVCYRPCSTGP